jgi:hypothetical protein
MFAFAIYFWMRRKELSLPKPETGTNNGAADIQAQAL